MCDIPFTQVCNAREYFIQGVSTPGHAYYVYNTRDLREFVARTMTTHFRDDREVSRAVGAHVWKTLASDWQNIIIIEKAYKRSLPPAATSGAMACTDALPPAATSGAMACTDALPPATSGNMLMRMDGLPLVAQAPANGACIFDDPHATVADTSSNMRMVDDLPPAAMQMSNLVPAPAPAPAPALASALAPSLAPAHAHAPALAPSLAPSLAPAPAPAHEPAHEPAPALAPSLAPAPAPAPTPEPAHAPVHEPAHAPVWRDSPTIVFVHLDEKSTVHCADGPAVRGIDERGRTFDIYSYHGRVYRVDYHASTCKDGCVENGARHRGGGLQITYAGGVAAKIIKIPERAAARVSSFARFVRAIRNMR